MRSTPHLYSITQKKRTVSERDRCSEPCAAFPRFSEWREHSHLSHRSYLEYRTGIVDRAGPVRTRPLWGRSCWAFSMKLSHTRSPHDAKAMKSNNWRMFSNGRWGLMMRFPYSPGGVVIFGSHCLRLPVQYTWACRTWNTSSWCRVNNEVAQTMSSKPTRYGSGTTAFTLPCQKYTRVCCNIVIVNTAALIMLTACLWGGITKVIEL